MAMIAAAFALVSAPAASAATTTTVYDATPSPLPPNVASLGFQATSTSEFGDLVILGGTDRALESVTVTMSDWALFSDYSSDIRYSGDSTNWTHPITVNVYDDSLGTNGVPDTLLATTTETVTIPWRPEADNTCSNPTAWRFDATTCYNGFAFNATFDLSNLNVTLPNEVIVGIAYNTQSYGSAPIGVTGPYNSLNVGIPSNQAVTAGADEDDDAVFWNTSHAAFYTDGGTAGVGTFREDTGWTPNGTVSFKISTTATLGGCLVDVNGSNPTVYTLLANCITDHTIHVPNTDPGGTIFDGATHSITAVNPGAGHYVGAVLQANAGVGLMTVENLTVTASGLTDVCDGGDDRLRGILFDSVGGTITNNDVTDIEQGPAGESGCQEGNGIEVRNAPFAKGYPKLNVTISLNTVTDYQKTGILVNGSVAAILDTNIVTGDGPITYIAENGVQIGFGATAKLFGNDVSLNHYSPPKVTACGLLLYKAGGVSGATGNGLSYVKAENNFHDNEKNICNFGKGGTFLPTS